MRTDDQLTHRSAAAPLDDQAPAPVFDDRTRVAVSAGIAAGVLAGTGLSALAAPDRDGYVLAHSLMAAPLVAGALVCSGIASRRVTPRFASFWRCWFAANVMAGLSVLAATGSVVLESPALLRLNMLLMTLAVPFWTTAAIRMVRLQCGRRDASVDVIDATMAVLVLSAPGVLVLARAVGHSADLTLAVPFALFLALVPAGLYLASVGLTRVPRGERAVHGLGLALGCTFTLSVALQLSRVVGSSELPVPVHVGVHGATMALVMALPLWAHRAASDGLGRLPVERQVRRNNPMPTVSAVVLPPLAAYVLLARSRDTWALAYLLFVLLAVIVLNALRHTRLSREAHRLSGELAGMAEDRRQLLASMVRALEDDRRRTVSELHSQTVGSLTTLGTVVQTACVSLPAATASVVREAIAQLQGDLNDRAEELRLLLAAMRPPAFDDAGARTGDDVLSAALRAYAAELGGSASGTSPEIRISVSPALELDRSTMTIVYRIAQEALLNAVRHAEGTRVAVSVDADPDSGAVVVEVVDDGVGFDPAAVTEGSGLASMRLFTDVGRGELTVQPAPGGGTLVRSRLGGRTAARRAPAAAPPSPRPAAAATGPVDQRESRPPAIATLVPPSAGRRHLRLVPSLDGPAGAG